MNPVKEKALIKAAQRGDKEAAAALYRAHVGHIYRYVVRRVNDSMIAEDITADVFVRALEALPQYQQRGLPFLGWLYHIASGKVIDYYRWMDRRKHHTGLNESLPSNAEAPESAAAHQLGIEQALKAMQILTEEQQRVLTLRFLEGRSIRETAHLMNKNENTVKALQFRALKTLSERLGRGVHDA